MTTMEERANKFALEKHPYSPFCEEYAKMYIEIATEQEAITKQEMIVKAWKFIESIVEYTGLDSYYLKEEYMKAMEE